MEDTKLSSTVTIEKYRQLEATEDKEAIADFLLERFQERYIIPLTVDPNKKHGFCIMAISCLLIEALESFIQGWPDTKGRSEEAFNAFFQHCADEQSELGIFVEYSADFYKGVRCGILHQAETTNGWRIRRKGPLFDVPSKVINATKFHRALEGFLQRYCNTLKTCDWNSEEWQNLRTKMVAIIENCRRERQ